MRFSQDDVEILVSAVEEISSHLDGLEDRILTMEKVMTVESVKDVYRAFHSVKGLAGFANLETVVKVAHVLESRLKEVMDGRNAVTPELVDHLLRGTDFIRSYIDHVRGYVASHSSGELEIPEMAGADDFLRELETVATPGTRPALSPNQETEKVEKRPNIQTSELFKDFFTELDENLEIIEREALEYERSGSAESLKALMRAFHSVKGGARLMLSFPENSDNQLLKDVELIAHKMEDLVQQTLEQGHQAWSVDLILLASDSIKEIVRPIRSEEQPNFEVIDSFFTELYNSGFLYPSSEPLEVKTGDQSGAIDVAALPGMSVSSEQKLSISPEVVRSIVLQILDFLAAMESDAGLNLGDFQRIYGPARRGLEELGLSEELAMLERVCSFVRARDFTSARNVINQLVQRLSDSIVTTSAQVKLHEGKRPEVSVQTSLSSFVRVEREKIEFLGNLSGELITFKNEFRYILRKVEHVDRRLFAEMKSVFGKFEKLSYDLQNATMALRMTPIGELFGRFKRTVRDLAKSLKKKVTLFTEGEDVQIDRNIVELLVDPLTHMVRNSVDHGIESPEERLQLGKPEEGRVVLRAYYSGNYAVVEVEDDGRGLDVEKIRYKAVERGLLTPDEAMSLPDEHVAFLIFEPGFSTKDSATEISGRGVGMDIVKTVADRVGGDVLLSYEKGKGTRIGLKLPLSLMIVRGLLVEVETERFIIPLDFVRETIKIPVSKIHSHKGMAFTSIRDEIVPVIFLEEVLLRKQMQIGAKDYSFGRVPLAVVEIDNRPVALAVDRFVEEGEYLIKSIPDEFKFGEVFTGATIMGDGSIVLIISPERLIRTR